MRFEILKYGPDSNFFNTNNKKKSSISVKCRVGVWNRDNDTQIFPIQEFIVPQENIAIHNGFKSFRTLYNDIAILRLPAPGVDLGLNPTITTICLPSMKS